MRHPSRWLLRRLLGIPPEEATFARRRFRGGADARIRGHLEQIGTTFLRGYHAALEEDADRLAARLEGVESDVRGFAYEGAAMALALLDHLLPGRRDRWARFLAGPGAAHAYMLHVGAGWVLARLPWLRRRPGHYVAGMDPLLRWLVLDGYGFHEGYFHAGRVVDGRRVPGRLAGYERRAFDQGLGRSVWFVEGADVARIAATIAAFPPPRQADLWAGVGLACAYAGGVGRETIETLRGAAGRHQPELAQGAAFAAKARQRAGNLAEHTERACGVICGLPAAEPAYEAWRRRIQARLAWELVRP